jgi:5-methylcytosine-specific restriction endonuclease McrA
MTTNRTATAIHKRMRDLAINTARAEGQQICLECGCWIDWEHSSQPNSPEADEIIPYVTTGHTSTDPANWRVICRTCNRSKGGKLGASRSTQSNPHRIETSQQW